MSHNEQLLPPNTKLIWEPASETVEQVARIKQHDGVFVFNYAARINPGGSRVRHLTPPRGAALACSFLGLTASRSATYQGISENSVKGNLTLVHKQLGITRLQNHRHGLQAAHALSRLCELDILELGRPATLANELDPSVQATVRWLLQGNSFTEIAVTVRKSPEILKNEFYTARDKEGFDTSMGYLLHLVGAQAVGNINYRPELMPAPQPAIHQSVRK